jgi:hypothetical protein
MCALWSALTRRRLLVGISGMGGVLGLRVIGANSRIPITPLVGFATSREVVMTSTAIDIRALHIDIPDEALQTCVDVSRPRTGPRKRPSRIKPKACHSL